MRSSRYTPRYYDSRTGDEERNMRMKRFVIPGFVLFGLLVGWHLASSFMIAKAIAPPNAPVKSIVRTMLHSPYQMATPHRNLLSSVGLEIVPRAQAACGTGGTCTGFEAKNFCGLNDCVTQCNNYCHCPNCSASGCTNYCCTYVGLNTICSTGTGTRPCEICERDQSSTNCTPTNSPAP